MARKRRIAIGHSMKLLILGATGRTGTALCKAANEAGHHVTALAGCSAEVAHANIVADFDDAAFSEAVQDADAVMSCLASSNTEPVCSTATQAILHADPTVRFVTVAGAAVDRPARQQRFP